MFPLVSLATIVPVLYLGLAGQTRMAGLLVGGFFLGIGGTAFAVGVPFVNAWFPPAAPWPRHRRLRRRHGRHRDQRPDHRQARRRLRAAGRRSCSPRSCWPCYAVLAAWSCVTPRAGPCRTEPLRRRLAEHAPAADHLAGGGPVRGRVRRLRRVLGVPARLPEDRLRADPGRRGQPDGRLRAAGRGDAAGRRLAVRPDRPVPVLAVGSRWSWSGAVVAGVHAAARRRRHHRVPGDGRGARRRQRRDVRPGRAACPGRQGRRRSPVSSAPPAASAGSCHRWSWGASTASTARTRIGLALLASSRRSPCCWP